MASKTQLVGDPETHVELPSFPVDGILPKDEIEAGAFLRRFPGRDRDGRGVVVAVFDTGVDPGAPGLARTAAGEAKVVDVVDCTGSGDVDMSKVVEVREDGTLLGLSGRALKVSPEWHNPTGKWRVGIKSMFELYPSPLVSRLRKEQAQRWDAQQRELQTEAREALAAFKAAHATLATQEEREQLAELEARLALLQSLAKKHKDPGPIVDCVLFHDGDVWRAVLDLHGDGDLTCCPPLADFRVERQFVPFSEHDLMNVSVKIYEDGNVLSIVTTAGMHGTHVAGIVGAYFPEQPELNGIAPGVQIVSVKIGDSRMGSMETGTGLVRGLIACLENNCDLINMSYGEATAGADSGRVCELARELVHKHGVVFVSSAGNAGPALTTAGAPGATTEGIIGVGAYVSPVMMEAEYNMRKTVPGNQYTWSSRGPTADGALGVCVTACGGAISPVPNWTLKKTQLANGTSMSSPAACGGIALILSALKARGIAYTPARVHRAVANTARFVPGIERFAQGRGLLQVSRAYDHLVSHAELAQEDLRFDVAVQLKGRRLGRGLYLREPHQLANASTVTVRVKPCFPHAGPAEFNRDKVDFEVRLTLVARLMDGEGRGCNMGGDEGDGGPCDWIDAPAHMLLMNQARTFDISVDPTRLPPGAHYAEILALDAADPARGPLFRVPITALVPQRLVIDHSFSLAPSAFTSGQVRRTFLHVPRGAQWANVTVHASDVGGGANSQIVVLHCLQLGPEGRIHDSERWASLREQQTTTISFPVLESRTLEVCLAQYWSSLGDSTLALQVDFDGVEVQPAQLVFDGSAEPACVTVQSHLGLKMVSPSGSVNKYRRALRPQSHKLRPLPDAARDTLPEGRRIHELQLTYSFQMKSAGKVLPIVPLLSKRLYESAYEAQLWMITDSNGQYLGSGDAFPQHNSFKASLSKGKYTLTLHIRHDDISLLEGLTDLLIYLEGSLPKKLSLKFFKTDIEAQTGSGKYGTVALTVGEQVHAYATPPAFSHSGDKLGLQPGDLLLGTATFCSEDKSKPSSGQHPKGYPVQFVVPAAPEASNKADKKPSSGADKEDEEFDAGTAVRDAHMKLISSLKGDKQEKAAEALMPELLNKFGDHVPLLQLQLALVDGHAKRSERLAEVIERADDVLAQIDSDAVAAFLGRRKPDDETDEEKKERKKMDELKGALVKTLETKAKALRDLIEQAADGDDTSGILGDFNATMREMGAWVDVTSAKSSHVDLRVFQLAATGQVGRAAKMVADVLDAADTADKAKYGELVKLVKRLGWDEWAEALERNKLVLFPPSGMLF